MKLEFQLAGDAAMFFAANVLRKPLLAELIVGEI